MKPEAAAWPQNVVSKHYDKSLEGKAAFDTLWLCGGFRLSCNHLIRIVSKFTKTPSQIFSVRLFCLSGSLPPGTAALVVPKLSISTNATFPNSLRMLRMSTVIGFFVDWKPLTSDLGAS